MSKKNLKTIIEKRSFLKSALKEMQMEIAVFKKEKIETEKQLDSIKNNINKTQEDEITSRSILTELTNKEVELNSKKERLMEKLEAISQKLEKIKKVESELSDV